MKPALRRWHDRRNEQTEERVLGAVLAEQDHATPRSIARATGFGIMRVQLSLKRLEQQGKIRASRDGRSPRRYAAIDRSNETSVTMSGVQESGSRPLRVVGECDKSS
jgi:DNA-binding transcriptional ArsR family regulator